MLLKVGALARQTGLTIKTLHHYDAIGLLIPSHRSDAGYRMYDRDDLMRLNQIQALKQLGFALADIGDTLAGDGMTLTDLIPKQLAELDRQIEQSTRLRTQLLFLKNKMDQGDTPEMADLLLTLELMTMYEKYFAGLMTCCLQKQGLDATADRTIIDLWKAIRKYGAETIFTGNNEAGNYLNGGHSIKKMESSLSELKQEDVQAHLFFQAGRIADLSRTVEEMRTFLADEERKLEEQAVLLKSSDIEIINSRLLSLKDICWILGKDILENLQKILTLSGSDKASAVNPAAFRKYRKLNLLLNALDRLEVRGRDSAGIQLTFS